MLNRDKLSGFYVGGGYYCRIIKGNNIEDYEEYINDLHYEKDIWLWDAQKGMHKPPKTEISEEEKLQYNGLNILLEIEKCIKPEFAASWVPLFLKLWRVNILYAKLMIY